MKRKNKYIILFFAIFALSSCSDFLDINKDVNNPTDSTLPQLLLAPELSIFDAFGDGSGGVGDLTGQWVHHTVQRGPSNFYFMDGNEFAIATAWSDIYNQALADLNIIIDKSQTVQAYNYLGIAKVLKAYTLATTVDIWGIAVNTEFGKGADNFAPKFDKGEDVYVYCLNLLTEAKADLAKNVASSLAIPELNSPDQIYKGKTSLWIKFANSLQLKLYNQVRLTSLYRADSVAALISKNNFMSNVSEGFRLLYTNSNTPENRHPLFTQDYIGSPSNYIDPYFYLFMKGDPKLYPLFSGIVDPRIPYFIYNQLATGETAQNKVAYQNGNFLSIWFASFNIDPNEGFDQGNSQTLVGLYPCGGAFDNGSGVNRTATSGQAGAGFQRLFPYHSLLFTRAELALTNNTGESASSLLGDAIDASFAEVNDAATRAAVTPITSNSIIAYKNAVLALFNNAANTDAKLEILLATKWVSNFKSGPDPYTDYRRTNYPKMFDPSTDNNPLTVLNRNYPVSFPINGIDIKTNPNAPKDRNPGSTKIFWDIN